MCGTYLIEQGVERRFAGLYGVKTEFKMLKESIQTPLFRRILIRDTVEKLYAANTSVKD